MHGLACEPPTEPRNFWLPESPDACEAENCGDPDHSKICATCNARLCPEHAKRCDDCSGHHCEKHLEQVDDCKLCLTCRTKAEAQAA